MDKIITDLNIISKKSLLNKEAVELFRARVKKIPVTGFDQLAAPVVKQITEAIDCTKCGNCCRHQEPGVTTAEMKILAREKKLSLKKFKDKFIARDRENVTFLCIKPCIFLDARLNDKVGQGNKCSVYTFRPNSCADFPGLLRPRLKWRMKQVEENYATCPIVFNVVERLMELI